MAFVLGDRPVRPLTADEVMSMVEAGILRPDERVELLHGALTRVSPQSPAHVEAKRRLIDWLGRSDGHIVRNQDPLVVPDRTSLPEPDIAVVDTGDYRDAHPTSALLVIEVAVSSLRTDMTIKPPLYAAAGIPELWVLDVDGQRLHVFRDPTPDGYLARTELGPGDCAEPLAVDVAPLALSRLFG